MNRTLVTLFDVQNESNFIVLDKIKIDRILFIIERDKADLYKEFVDSNYKLFKDKKIEQFFIKESFISDIKQYFSKSEQNYILNVTNGEKINILILFNYFLLRDWEVVYIDLVKKYIYSFGKQIIKSKEKFNDFYIKDLTLFNGFKLLNDSSELIEDERIVDLAMKIFSNIDIWNKYKYYLYNNEIFNHHIEGNDDKNLIIVNLEMIDSKEKKILDCCLRYLETNKIIKCRYQNNKIEVLFTRDTFKAFIFKSGTWLEVLTHVVIEQISEIDEVRNGVVFVWNEEDRIINELDVVAVKDCNLICISCKDSDKYDEDALNELNVCSERIGGRVVKKILVATKMPVKKTVIDRASAMGIHIIVLGDNLDTFKENLRNIIK